MYWIFLLDLTVFAQPNEFEGCSEHQLLFLCDRDLCEQYKEDENGGPVSYCWGCITEHEGQNCYWNEDVNACIKKTEHDQPPHERCIYINLFDVDGGDADPFLVPWIEAIDPVSTAEIRRAAEDEHYWMGDSMIEAKSEVNKIKQAILTKCAGKTGPEEIAECVMEYVQERHEAEIDALLPDILEFVDLGMKILEFLPADDKLAILSELEDILLALRASEKASDVFSKRQILQEIQDMMDSILNLIKNLNIVGFDEEKCKMKDIRNKRIYPVVEHNCLEYSGQTIMILKQLFPETFTAENTKLVGAFLFDKLCGHAWIMHIKTDNTKLYIDACNDMQVIDKGIPPFQETPSEEEIIINLMDIFDSIDEIKQEIKKFGCCGGCITCDHDQCVSEWKGDDLNCAESPTRSPTTDPTRSPTTDPTQSPTTDPTRSPTTDPTRSPTTDPTRSPTTDPTRSTTAEPITSSTSDTTAHPTTDPTRSPTRSPTTDPTEYPTIYPTTDPITSSTSDTTAHPTTDPTEYPTIYPTTDPTTDPTVAPTRSQSTTRLPIEACKLWGRGIDTVILNDISGAFKNEDGISKASECRKHQNMVALTLIRIKSSYSRVAYIEYDNNVHAVISMNNHLYNDDDSSLIMDYYNLIDGRCDGVNDEDLQYKTCGNNVNLFGALQEAQNQFSLHPTGIDIGRDRYIIIFSNCKVSDLLRDDICDGFEDFIRSGMQNADRGANQNGKGINVIMVNMGYEFEDNGDDYILCLVEYDDKRIYQSSNRNKDVFNMDGLEATIVNEICNSPTPAPTTDPTIDPTSDPTTISPQQAAAVFVKDKKSIFDELSNNNNITHTFILTILVLIAMVSMNIICCTLCIKKKKGYHSVVHNKEFDIEKYDEESESDENIPIHQ